MAATASTGHAAMASVVPDRAPECHRCTQLPSNEVGLADCGRVGPDHVRRSLCHPAGHVWGLSFPSPRVETGFRDSIVPMVRWALSGGVRVAVRCFVVVVCWGLALLEPIGPARHALADSDGTGAEQGHGGAPEAADHDKGGQHDEQDDQKASKPLPAAKCPLEESGPAVVVIVVVTRHGRSRRWLACPSVRSGCSRGGSGRDGACPANLRCARVSPC